MIRINNLPAPQRAFAEKIAKGDGVLTLEELRGARAAGLVGPNELKTFESLEQKLLQLEPAETRVSTPAGFDPWAASTGSAAGVEHTFKRDGASDTYTLLPGKDGIRPGGELVLPIPADREGQEIQNIDVSFHAPLRQWNHSTQREEKPTYCHWYSDREHLMRKFVDPNADNGNAPEIDNIHPPNASDMGVLAKAGKTIRIAAVNEHIPADETAMTVQWVRITYKPKNVDVVTTSFRGESLPNTEWKGKWIAAGESFSIPTDPARKVSRVEIHWSDKPDDVGYNDPGKWALGTVSLDGATLGNAREHVGSPEWQGFEGRGAMGKALTIRADASPLKLFEVKVYYEK